MGSIDKQFKCRSNRCCCVDNYTPRERENHSHGRQKTLVIFFLSFSSKLYFICAIDKWMGNSSKKMSNKLQRRHEKTNLSLYNY